MTGEFGEVEALVERLGSIIDAIKYHRDEGKGLPGLIAVAERLCEQRLPQSLTVSVGRHPKPREYRDRQHSAWEFLRHICGQIAEINLPSRKRVITRDHAGLIEQHFRDGEMLFLILKCLRFQPVIHLRLTTGEGFPWMSLRQPFQVEASRKLNTHDLPRMSLLSFFCAAVSLTGALRAVQNASCSSGVI